MRVIMKRFCGMTPTRFLQRGLSTRLTTADYDSFISDAAAARRPSAIRALMPLLKIPGMISLGGGMPNPSTFPFKSLTVELEGGESFKIEGPKIQEALQYSPTNGLPGFMAHLDVVMKHFHNENGSFNEVPRSSMVSTGSQDALSKSFEMLLNRGDSLLVEAPTYSGSLAFLKPFGANLVGVEADGEGLIPKELDHVLSSWDVASQGKKPKVLYTIPNGSNPTGGSLNEERRRQIYQIARHHNLLILEDDPYYFLQFNERPLSLTSMDEDGRVLRFDSMSKLMSAGLRLGWATGPVPLIDRLALHMQSTSLHTSGISQSLVAGLLDHWEQHGGVVQNWSKHADLVSSIYRHRRDVFNTAAEKHLTGLAEWSTPTAGMFCWMKLLCLEGKNGEPDTDSTHLVKTTLADAKVLFVPGCEFSPDASVPSPYIRASFSTASEADMDIAMERLAGALRTLAK